MTAKGNVNYGSSDGRRWLPELPTRTPDDLTSQTKQREKPSTKYPPKAPTKQAVAVRVSFLWMSIIVSSVATQYLHSLMPSSVMMLRRSATRSMTIPPRGCSPRLLRSFVSSTDSTTSTTSDDCHRPDETTTQTDTADFWMSTMNVDKWTRLGSSLPQKKKAALLSHQEIEAVTLSLRQHTIICFDEPFETIGITPVSSSPSSSSP